MSMKDVDDLNLSDGDADRLREGLRGGAENGMLLAGK